MHPLRHFLAGAACALCLLPAFPATVLGASQDADVQRLDGIAAVVNESLVLDSELEAEVRRVRDRLRREGEEVPPTEVLRERILEELILEKIQLQRARRRGISVSDSEVVEALRNMARDRGTDLAGLREALADQERSFEQLRENVRDQLIISRLRQRVVASQVEVSEQAVEDFMAQVERASDRRTELRLRHILVGLPSDPDEADVEAARQRVAELRERLADGASFPQLATRVSDGPRALEGGDLGWRRRSQLPGLFLEAVEDLSPGELAEPVRSPNGFHLLKLVDRRGGAQQTITEYEVSQILLRDQDGPEGDGDEGPQAQLARLRDRITGGADFAELARAHSDDPGSAPSGGDLGWVGPGDVPPVFGEVLQNLRPGQVSEPFRSPRGWHLVKLHDRRERSDIEAYQRAQARRTLYRRQVDEETQRWLQELRDEAFVEVRIDS